MDEATFQRVLALIKKRINQFEESSEIVGFFQKNDEIRTMKRNIRRAMILEDFEDPELIKAVTERFMDLGKVKFR